VTVADTLADGWKCWRDWIAIIAPDNVVERQAVEADAGRHLGYVRAVCRRRSGVELPDPIVSIPTKYTAQPLLKNRPADHMSVSALKLSNVSGAATAASSQAPGAGVVSVRPARRRLVRQQGPCHRARLLRFALPAEIVFDPGVGDLFVIRVAGNIMAPSQVDGVEFAAERYGTRLVVLGHSGAAPCWRHSTSCSGRASGSRKTCVRSSIACVPRSRLLDTELRHDRDALCGERCAPASRLRQSSPPRFAGARTAHRRRRPSRRGRRYSLDTGIVGGIDDVPAPISAWASTRGWW
jgi:carbonic anhydrase